eukprot:CAMPEP_0175897192 /NCGR_PEP_ID=MMETSP0108-20121206/583_1 /TAXON_ID=195067 ORGANISM="Goniomonas pacifica, Strain CCMP1869" /NCGR_SAMPLE_ID=MMETSP0108 /ASSEMBLY_ACC=CAM_ASM_000204 /LENGTH=36 /DNA_ID= /DNA_START= /DNA_END= /DNA_ORIENTATION=
MLTSSSSETIPVLERVRCCMWLVFEGGGGGGGGGGG